MEVDPVRLVALDYQIDICLLINFLLDKYIHISNSTLESAYCCIPNINDQLSSAAATNNRKDPLLADRWQYIKGQGSLPVL